METSKGTGNYGRFGWDRWHELFEYLERGFSRKETARRMGCHCSSISRALERSGPRNRWERRLPWHVKAQIACERDQARKAKKRKRKRIPDAVVRIYIHEKLQAGYTPELVSGRLRQEHPGKSVSTETIYQYVYREAHALIKHLVIASKRGNRKRTSRKKYRSVIPAAEKRSIEKRTAAVMQRAQLGHWEVDTIVSRKSSFCVLTLIERKTRYRFYLKLPCCRAEEAKNALVRVLKQLPREYIQTLTMDNGPENALHRVIEQELGILTYFCHPYAAHERGSVEYANRQCRTKFPKGTDFALVSQQQLDAAAYFFNHRPMKCLGFHTPYEVFLPVLQSKQAAA